MSDVGKTHLSQKRGPKGTAEDLQKQKRKRKTKQAEYEEY